LLIPIKKVKAMTDQRKKILVLGAGMVAPPLVEYLNESTPFRVILADQQEERIRLLVSGRPRIDGIVSDISEPGSISQLINQADLVISILPAEFHSQVAKICVQLGKDLITASYVSDETNSLDSAAREKGILLLNETGLDPGIDHMEAMRIIREVKDGGGEVLAFTSYCGGLPAPEANTNPLGFKFSWSPIGVLMAGKNIARYLEDGKPMEVLPETLFKNPWPIQVEGLGVMDGYPNRDSLPYIQLYGIEETRCMLRGTLRWPGWCPFIHAAGELGYLDKNPAGDTGRTYAEFLRSRVGVKGPEDLREALAGRLGLDPSHSTVQTFEWLGLAADDPLPEGETTGLSILVSRMMERLTFGERERDMIVLRHQFKVRYPESGREEEIVSTLIDYGIPGGHSAMARTVGLPLAVCAKLILEGRIPWKGVQIPIHDDIYRPVLEELKSYGIVFRESRK
jgi:saccharopine dehydrogenase-like NADP-dependent oxidoreductase